MIFYLTADARRRTQTFLPADPAGKKHVNRFAINNIYVPVKIYRAIKPLSGFSTLFYKFCVFALSLA
jgi:hypothetical protein